MPPKADDITSFVAITGASTKEAKKFLTKHKRLDVAIDAFYNNSSSSPSPSPPPSNSRIPSTAALTTLFNKYKDPDGEDITVDGTISLCEDLSVDPEDIVMLAVAYELKSPRLGIWTKQGWIDGWKSLRCDNLEVMKQELPRLRDRLASDSDYFKLVYNHTFDFARSEGQRSLALETAQAFWALLLPHGLKGGALSHISSTDADNDVDMGGTEQGWSEKQTDLWFNFLSERAIKGISRDTWQMFFEFVRTIDSRFSNYDQESAWPSTFDDFVEFGKKQLI